MPLSNPTTPERDLLAVTYDKVKEIRVVDTDDQSKVLAIENLAIAGTKVTVAVDGLSDTVDRAFEDVLTKIGGKADTAQVGALDTEKADHGYEGGETVKTLKGVEELTTAFFDVYNYIGNSQQLSKGSDSIGKILRSDGSEAVNSSFNITDYIPVNSFANYFYRSRSNLSDIYAYIVFYDNDKNMIHALKGGINYNTATYKQIAIPSYARYFRASYVNTDLEFGIYAAPVVNGLDKVHGIANIQSINLFDRNKSIHGFFIYTSGTLVANSSSFVSDFIALSEGETLKINTDMGSGGRIQQYDVFFNEIEGANTPSSDRNVTGVSNCRYVRFTGNVADINKAMAVKGEMPNQFIPFDSNSVNTYYSIHENQLLKVGGFPIVENLQQVEATFVQGKIFNVSNAGFETSDYIPISYVFSNYYIYLKQQLGSSFKLIEFYDKDKNILATINGGNYNGEALVYKIIEINPPRGTQYMRFCRAIGDVDYGLFTLKNNNFKDVVLSITNSIFTDTSNILWLGTSIPAGSEYPKKASEACGYTCINKSMGSSQMVFTNQHPSTVYYYSGRCLTATVAELEALYREDVQTAVITESQLEEWKNYSYERAVIPYINGNESSQVSAIVIDHGYNDRQNIVTLLADGQAIDWDSRDRSNFIGACNYFFDRVFEANPFMKIIICGYLQNTVLERSSEEICTMQTLISEKWGFPLMPVWKYSGMSNQFVAGTSDYLENFNLNYGTNYVPIATDGEGNIMAFNVFCPDGVHPHTDMTGNSNIRLNAVITKLLRFSL